MSENPDPTIPLDYNKIFTNLAEKLITTAASSAYSKTKGVIKGLSNDHKIKLQKYESYLAHIYKTYSKAKSFLIRDESTQLYDFYVPMGVSLGNKISVEASIFNFEVNSRFAVIEGSAGSGKSMLMRHLLLNTVDKEIKIPVFIELRRINEFDGDLISFIKTTLVENKFNFDDDYIEKALIAGHFTIFLDGFDEVDITKRNQIIKEIQALARDFVENIIIVSSRPDTEYSSWSLFDIWRITPLTLKQATELIRKVPSKNIDKETRDKFLADLKETLFKKHKSFLSNPLLLSIMAITYASCGDVPDKISTFYENAYIALFERHDILKGAFKRDRRCDLDIFEFKKIFSAFSILSANNRFNDSKKNYLRFPKTEALSYIKTAKEISIVSKNFSDENFLEDCLKAVCLLLEDGLQITYAHRSFQEYFAAVFISELDDAETQKEIISSYIQDPSDDETLTLLNQINPSIIERVFLIPCLGKLEKEIEFEGAITLINYRKFLEYCFNKERAYVNYIDYRGVIGKPIKMGEQELSFTAKLNDDPERNLMAWVFKYVFQVYLKGCSFGISPESNCEIEKLIKSKLDGKPVENIPFFLNDEVEKIIFKDKILSFSEIGLNTLFNFKKKLEEKHKRIDIARKENLLKGMRSIL